MDVVVKSHRCTVSDHFREYVEDKITKLEKLNQRAIRVEVEVSAEKNPRQHDTASRVEITLRTKGPVVRAEAAAAGKTAAFDLALDRLLAQLRRAADRKRHHHSGRRAAPVPREITALDGVDRSDEPSTTVMAGLEVQGEGPLVVREKLHRSEPMTLDRALLEMELVGHDFFLFVHADTMRPSVVYRRKGYDYGVISLDVVAPADDARATADTAADGDRPEHDHDRLDSADHDHPIESDDAASARRRLGLDTLATMTHPALR